MTDLPVPICKLCFAKLPMTFQGFDICPMCVYLSEVQKAKSPHGARVSYQSPLVSLDRELSGSH